MSSRGERVSGHRSGSSSLLVAEKVVAHSDGIRRLREQVAQYVNEQLGCGDDEEIAQEDVLSRLTAGPAWDLFLGTCSQIADHSLSHTVNALGPAAADAHGNDADPPESTNVMCFDVEEAGHRDTGTGAASSAYAVGEFSALLAEINNTDTSDPAQDLSQRLAAVAGGISTELSGSVSALAATPSRPSLVSANSVLLADRPTAESTVENRHARLEFLLYVKQLMEGHAEVVLQSGDWADLVGVLVACARETPKLAIPVLEKYFAAAAARQRFLVVYQLVSCVDSFVTGSAGSESFDGAERTQDDTTSDDRYVLSVIRQMMEDLPLDWVVILDRELEALLERFLLRVALPREALLSTLDPCAEWLAKWCERPSVSNVVACLPVSRPAVMDAVEAALRSLSSVHDASHSLTTTAYLLSSLIRRDCTGCDKRVVGLAATFATVVCGQAAVRDLSAAVKARLTQSLHVCARVLPTETQCVLAAACVQNLQANNVLSVVMAEEGSATLDNFLWQLDLLNGILEGLTLIDEIARDERATRNGEALKSIFEELHKLTRQLREGCKRPKEHGDAYQAVLTFWKKQLRSHSCLCAPFLAKTLEEARMGDLPAVAMVVEASRTTALWQDIASQMELRNTDDTDSLIYAHILDSILPDAESAVPLSDSTQELTMESCVLLMRWCTLPRAHHWLLSAATRRLCALKNSTFVASGKSQKDWLLYVPVELYTSEETAAVAFELTVAQQRELGIAALYQTVRMLLAVLRPALRDRERELDPLALPVSELAAGDDAESRMIELVWNQVQECYTEDSTSASPELDTDGCAFGEDSLLCLLSAAAVCLLLSPEAERRAWRLGASSRGRLRQVRSLCASRRGVDPVYFLVRFLTSGKGKKRLLPVFLHGFHAELRVETTIDVDSFVDGEEFPRDTALSLPQVRERAHALVRQASAGASESASVNVSDALLLEACYLVASKMTSADDELLEFFQLRSVKEWEAFAAKKTRADAVAIKLIALDSDHSVLGALESGGIDVYFLSLLCVTNWLTAPPLTDETGKLSGGNLLRSSQKQFVRHGVAGWEDCVAKSLYAFAHALATEDAFEVDDGGERRLPTCSPVPVPSPLFALLLTKTFTLEKMS